MLSSIPTPEAAVASLPLQPFYSMPDPESESAGDAKAIGGYVGLAEHMLTTARAADPATPEGGRIQYNTAVLAAGMAFLATRGIVAKDTAHICRELGRLSVRGAFPGLLGAYAAGHYDDISVQRLRDAGTDDEQAALADALKAYRRRRFRLIRAEVQTNEITAIRSSRTGEPLTTFEPDHWQQLTWRIGYTSLFDLILTDSLPAELNYPALAEALTAVALAYVERWQTLKAAPVPAEAL